MSPIHQFLFSNYIMQLISELAEIMRKIYQSTAVLQFFLNLTQTYGL